MVKLEEFYRSIGVPENLSTFGITDEYFEAMGKHIDSHWMAPLKAFVVPFEVSDVVEVLKRCL